MMQRETTEGFRLSPQQRHLWTLQQGDGGAPYRTQCVVMIEGAVEADALMRGVAAAVGRHEILRTAFRFLPGTTLPVQVVTDGSAAAVDERDLSDLPPERQRA